MQILFCFHRRQQQKKKQRKNKNRNGKQLGLAALHAEHIKVQLLTVNLQRLQQLGLGAAAKSFQWTSQCEKLHLTQTVSTFHGVSWHFTSLFTANTHTHTHCWQTYTYMSVCMCAAGIHVAILPLFWLGAWVWHFCGRTLMQLFIVCGFQTLRLL